MKIVVTDKENTVYQVIFMTILFSLFSQSRLHFKIFNMQKLYLVLFAIRYFTKSPKMTDANKNSYTIPPHFCKFCDT